MWLGWISRLRTLVKLLTLLAMTVVSSEGWTGPGSVPGSSHGQRTDSVPRGCVVVVPTLPWLSREGLPQFFAT